MRVFSTSWSLATMSLRLSLWEIPHVSNTSDHSATSRGAAAGSGSTPLGSGCRGIADRAPGPPEDGRGNVLRGTPRCRPHLPIAADPRIRGPLALEKWEVYVLRRGGRHREGIGERLGACSRDRAYTAIVFCAQGSPLYGAGAVPPCIVRGPINVTCPDVGLAGSLFSRHFRK